MCWFIENLPTVDSEVLFLLWTVLRFQCMFLYSMQVFCDPSYGDGRAWGGTNNSEMLLHFFQIWNGSFFCGFFFS